MLKFHTSYRVDDLADSFIDICRDNPMSNPLKPEICVVQNYGMARWLSLYIAENESIAANLQFKFPAEVFWQVIRSIESGIPEDLPSERLPMTWTIFLILLNDSDASLAHLHQYTQHDDPEMQEMRCWQLACRIGDVFDQYLTYRPQKLLRWQKTTFSTRNETEDWQAELWKKLNEFWNGEKWVHRANIQNNIFKRLDNEKIEFDALPERISIFAVTEIPPVYLKLFIKLSKYTDLHFYNTRLPAQDNILIESLGRADREFKTVIDELLMNDRSIEYENISVGEKLLENSQTLLDQFKMGLLSDESDSFSVEIDDTIQVHSCHSARREIEVLHDQLLSIFDANPGINPTDVIVLSPQMDEYAPDIEAVFGAVEDDIPRIPYHLAESVKVHTVEISFLKLLQIVDSRFRVTDVLDLLDFKPIRDGFSFTNDNINTLENWIEDTHIRWGMGESQKKELGLPATESFTWRSGLHRMMSGYAMESKDELLLNKIYPYQEIQQSEHAHLLGRFSKFVHELFRFHNEISQDHTPIEWSSILSDWITVVYSDDQNYFKDVQSLRTIIADLSNHTGRVEFDKQISFRILRDYVKDRVDQQQTGGGRSGRGVTFSPMIPMRNIPSKVICLVGMNDGSFPRSSKAPAFDLMAQDPEPGDRIQSKIDRQIFLESITAAEDILYFSYVGQSNQKDIDLPPSVLIREVTDYLDKKHEIIFDDIVQYHRLHAFSPAYFNSNIGADLFSYSNINSAIAKKLTDPGEVRKAFLNKQLPTPDNSLKTLSVGDFVSFFQHPSRYLMNQRLGVYLREESVIDEDRELFQLDGLDRYSIGLELLDRYLENKSLESFKDVARATDLLPEGWPGDQAFLEQKAEAQSFGHQIKPYLEQDKLEPLEVDYESKGFRILGRLNKVYRDRQLFYRFGSLRAKDRIELWIKHLLLHTLNPESHSCVSEYIGRTKNGSIESCRLGPVSEPQHIIDDLIELYWQGMQEQIFIFPESSYAYAEAIHEKNKDEEGAIKAAHKKWDNDWAVSRECDDPYNKLYLSNTNILGESMLYDKFRTYSNRFWKPFFNTFQKK